MFIGFDLSILFVSSPSFCTLQLCLEGRMEQKYCGVVGNHPRNEHLHKLCVCPKSGGG